MSLAIDDVLNECIERLAAGETVQECVARYPDHAADLEPLLQTSAIAVRTASAIAYRPDAKRRSLYKLTAALDDRARAGRSRRIGLLTGWRGKLTRTVAVVLSVAVLATGTAFGAARASEDSVPGDPLYAVKTFKEDISLRMPKSDIARAKEHAHLATVRTDEIAALIDRGRFEQANALVVRVTYHLNSSAQLVGVTITANANPFEMPAVSAPKTRQHQADELVSFYERDMQPVRSRFQRRMQDVPEQQQREALLMMAHWEMMNRMYLQALSYDGPPHWPVWIDARASPGQ